MKTTQKKPDQRLPSFDEMYAALCARDSHYEGVFIVGVRTTGIFCRPTCPARKPNRENVTFYSTTGRALAAGFRPCKKCRPMRPADETPPWVESILRQMEEDPSTRWTDERLRQTGIHPATLRRWFNRNYGMTFQGYQRARRLGHAASQIGNGKQVTRAALDIGYDSQSGFRDAFRKWCGDNPCEVQPGAEAMTVDRIVTPLGPIVVAAVDDAICMLEFADRHDLESQIRKMVGYVRRPVMTGGHRLFDLLENQLGEYFAQQRVQFDVPLHFPGTPFQTQVWDQLLKIPYGQVCSYQSIANQISKAGAQRAVGRANGSNRLAILIPCHRVVRSDGKPGGYAGEIWRKRRLLDLESRG